MRESIRDQLQKSLGDAYTIERELGGGGMSRVFIAQENALGRTVVVKVLPPELAAELSNDRFAREVKLAAQLQDPHIVPLLAAGDAGGLPYYTMPYVAGDSLRERLRRGPRLPMSEAIEVMRGMLLALAAAHDAGVVHRDVKPENVLLTRAGTPMVTDFGIAKAVAASRTEADGSASALTQLGMSIGTPAYMSPEQAAGGAVDHRADLYAWGMVAYELLAGAHPFAAKTNAQQLIAAQLTEVPASLASRAVGVPKDLVVLVERSLAKAPDDRPSSAREAIRALDAATGRNVGGTTLTARSRARLGMAIGAAAVILLAAAAVFATVRERSAVAAASLSPARVVVLPFDNRTGDSALAPLGAMAADWITRGLAETGLVDVASVATGGVADSARLSASRAALAGTLLTGTVYRFGDSVRIVAIVTDVNADRVVSSLDPVTASVADPLTGLEMLRRRVAGALAQRVDPTFDTDRLMGVPPSFEVYRAILDARALRDNLQLEKAGETLQRAAALDTGYARLVLEEYQVRALESDFARMDTLQSWLTARRARLTPPEATLLDLLLDRREGGSVRALAATQRMVALAPRSAEALAFLGFTVLSLNRPYEADSIFARVDTARVGRSSRFWVDRAYAARLLGDHKRELAFVDAALRHSPGNDILVGWRIRALASLGRIAEVQRVVGELTGVREEIFAAAIAGLLAAGRPADAKTVADSFAKRILARRPVRFNSNPVSAMYPVAANYFSGHGRVAMRLVDSLIAALPSYPAHKLIPGIESDYPIWLLALRGAMLAGTGDTAQADAVDRELLALRPRGLALRVALVGRAVIAAQLGRREVAVARLREAMDGGASFASTNPGSVLIVNTGIAPDSPWLAPLRGYAPFETLMRPAR